MHISRVIVNNYRCLRTADVELNSHLNILVGNNECGKSTLLEAINLALTGQLNGRPIQIELHPHLFNADAVSEYIKALKENQPAQPPSLFVELYFDDDSQLVSLKGSNNTENADCPGVVLTIEFNQEYAEEFSRYISDPNVIRSIPVEYYMARWRSFAGNDITSRSVPIKPSFIDASIIRNNAAASRYVIDIVRDSLSRSQKVDLALSYRLMKDAFMDDAKVRLINDALAGKRGEITDKTLSIALDTSSRSTWEMGVMPQLDDIPISLVGKGEQNSVKIKLAMESSADSHLVLVEEAENHLSYSNLNELISHIADNRGERQLILTTHSSFVLNKLGVESVILFHRGHSTTLKTLSASTHDYFMRLPGHDTLRLILARRAILVEGPSDELVVQAAYRRAHGKMPLEDGVDVISVNSLAFRRFLEISVLLKAPVSVVTDNDGKVEALQRKYHEYRDNPDVRVFYDTDESRKTLEPQLLKANGAEALEAIIGRTFSSAEELLDYMTDHKADTALKLFTTEKPWNVPEYIARAVA